MSDRPLKLLLVDQDPIFRLGLRVALEEFPNLQVVSQAATDTAALQILAELAQQDPTQINLVVLELGNTRSTESQQQGLQLCQQLKAVYPTLPILLFSSVQEPGLLLAAKATGVNGYCSKGTPVAELVTAMEEVARGNAHWFDETNRDRSEVMNTQYGLTPLPLARLRNNLRLSGIGYIDVNLAAVTAQLQSPDLPILDRAILAGQRREMLAARWLLNRLLLAPQEKQQQQQFTPSVPLPVLPSSSNAIVSSDLQETAILPSLLSPRALQSALFASCVSKLQFSLENVSDIPLEIDILREDKKRELLYLILQKLTQQLDELRDSQIKIHQLEDLKTTILYDLWQAAVTDYFGKFSQVPVGKQNLEIVKLLLQNSRVVQTEIINQIPLVVELLSYLLFQQDLNIDNTSYSAGSKAANLQVEKLLENLLIQIANSVVQPLLNYLADVETIKQNFYDRNFISTRQIERFRNDLSWKYRINQYINQPKAIFESIYELFVLAPRGIAKTAIYAPRSQELAQLSGIPLLVTLILEFRDAIAPRLQSLLSISGRGIIFILTQIIGRGLGLIGRGILQGVGSVSFQEKNFRRGGEGKRSRGGEGRRDRGAE